MLLRVIKDLFKSQTDQENEALEAVQLFVKEGQYPSACELLELLLQRNPTHAGCHWELAQCYYKMGDNAKALAYCEKTRALDPTSVPAFTLLSQLRLPGEDYREVLERLIAHLKPRTYVEVGSEANRLLHLAKTAKSTLGIQPNADWGVQHDVIAKLGDRRVDLAFIHDVHQFEQALRDFAQLEQASNRDSVILVGGSYPLDEESANREPASSNHSGDIWRLVVVLKKYRPDLQINTVGTAPTGLTVIQNLNPESGFAQADHAPMIAEMMALPYSYLDEGKAEKLNLFINHWPRVKSMVRPRAR